MNKKISYKIQKSKYPDETNKYIVIYESESERGYGCGRLFKGTQQQCKEYKEGLENESKRASKRVFRKI